jgi:CHAT domain-containing protein
MAELEKEREELEQKLAGLSQEFAKYQAARALTPADLQKCLPPAAAFIDFLAYGDKVAAFVTTRDSIARVDLVGGGKLAEMVKDFTAESSLLRQRPVQGKGDESKLYAAVWEPLLPHLKGAKLVLICPDGPLCRLPFAALRGTDPRKYLIEEVAVAVVPVPRVLPELLASPAAKPAAPGASLLAVGDVDFGADPGAGKLPGEQFAASPTRAGGPLGWNPLPGTRKEVEAVKELFLREVPKGRFKALTRGDATEAALRRLAGEYRYLHLATHGFFADPARDAKPQAKGFEPPGGRPAGPNPGLLCGIVCAGANKPTPDDDGVLTALEVAEMDLHKVELAVLSACETGLGRVAGGEGVLGLQRAFHLAGARATVTTLWQAPDAAAAAVMGRFYENRLKKGMPALEALREAQLWFLSERVKQEGNELVKIGGNPARRTPPLFWAAFTLSGDWR